MLWFTSILAILLTSSPAYPQREFNVWQFGANAGIDFNTDPPSGIVGPTGLLDSRRYDVALEGTATICHAATGRLLLSTDGVTVWNGKGQKLRSGDYLNGHSSSTQSALILPFPKDTNKYYIFTIDQCGYEQTSRGLQYSVADISRDNGRGEVIQKNVRVIPLDGGSEKLCEKLTAVPHSNGCDTWIITHSMSSNEYYATLVHDSSVSASPVASAVGESPNTNDLGGYPRTAGIGWLVASRDGRKLAYAGTYGGGVQVVSFDPATGRCTDPLTVISAEDASEPYGVCFSPDRSKLYVTVAKPTWSLYQFDLSVVPLQIPQTKCLIDSTDGLLSIRPGPDERLYLSQVPLPTPDNEPWVLNRHLAVLTHPNAKGHDCGYKYEGIPLAANTSSNVGLPNVLDAFLGKAMRPCLTKPISINRVDTMCSGDCTTLIADGAAGRRIVWKLSDGRTIVGDSSTVCFTSSAEVEVLAITDLNDTARAKLPLYVSTMPVLKLLPEQIVTDTIGALVKVPIVLSQVASGSYTAKLLFKPSELDYLGCFDKAGNRIDVGEKWTIGKIHLEQNLTADSVLGYLFFNLYWSAGGECKTIEVVEAHLNPSEGFCVSNRAEISVCLAELCGTRILSQYVQQELVKVSIAPNPSDKYLSILSSADIENASIKVVNASGDLVLAVDAADVIAGLPFLLNVAGLSNGTYFIFITNGALSSRVSTIISR